MSSLNDFDVNNLDFNNMGSWPLPVKVLTGAIVFGLVILLGYQFFISDDEDTLAREVRKEAQLKQEYEQKYEKAVHLEAYIEQMKSIQSSFKTLLKQLPRSSEVAGLVDEVTYAANGAGLEVKSMKLKEEQDRDIYIEKPIEISVTGSYHQLAEFVSRVSNLPRIVTLHNFEITVTDKEVFGAPNEKMLVMNVTAKTYRYDDDLEGGE
ncbi:type 4a pilus biogenesis protein PilO [Pleionea sp. CnH1-48]|uniref:type 4a pilus biogenesis protein PilO n=1 Tax=Pleionea sp. CnH1-48 TaxID=2954494 RepID=UPI002096C432|nr:type 4a pilus biogenesis protein PilO [Pleionea sp. CnH1-48]MCO7224478.1 type 4a pilus biogenesis protein PilO [Pleionea sp. CnH1-48]